MSAFYKTRVTKDLALHLAKKHERMDSYRQGLYWDESTQKGCSVGCILESLGEKPWNHSAYPRLFGIPEDLARLQDCIFERLSVEDSKTWTYRFFNAIPEKKDLKNDGKEFLIYLLTDNEDGIIKNALDENKYMVERASDLIQRQINGENVDRELNEISIEARYNFDFCSASDAVYASTRPDAAVVAVVAVAVDGAAAAESNEMAKKQANKLIEILSAS